MEFIFDYDDDFDRLLQIIHVVVKRVDHYEEKDEYPLLALEMRFMAYRFAHALSRDLVYSHTRYKLLFNFDIMILFYISTIYKYIYSVKNNLKCDI